jgi:hypothetical protein
MSSIAELQQALDRLFEAEPWDPIAVERTRAKLSSARDAELFAQDCAKRARDRDEAALHSSRSEELFLLQKANLSQDRAVRKAPQVRVRSPPPASHAAIRYPVSQALGLEAELSQPDLHAPIVEDAPLLPCLMASFHADMDQHCKTSVGMHMNFSVGLA